MAALSFNEGVTKVQFYWWGARIYLSKTTVNYIGSGIAIAGIWIPSPVLSKMVSTLGVAAGSCPGGIIFDYNFLGTAIPPLSFIAVSNIRFQ